MRSALPATLACVTLAAAFAVHAAGSGTPPEKAQRSSEPPELRFTRGAGRDDAATGALIRGWDALRRDDLAASREAYDQALREDGRNLDALRGLAAIALRQGQPEAALLLYRRIRELAPQDVEAAMALAPGEDAAAEESRLKILAATADGVSAVHAALGRLYARQGRWLEAEQAWFAAVAGEPEHPDHHYNLAVCLDRLARPQLAARYYRSALARAADQPPAFDATLARARLAELEAR